jgi:hypothetical protein
MIGKFDFAALRWINFCRRSVAALAPTFILMTWINDRPAPLPQKTCRRLAARWSTAMSLPSLPIADGAADAVVEPGDHYETIGIGRRGAG